jgi:hypothetical protein
MRPLALWDNKSVGQQVCHDGVGGGISFQSYLYYLVQYLESYLPYLPTACLLSPFTIVFLLE